MNKKTIDQIFKTLSDLNPEPKTELNYVNNYTLLVAVVLSAQSTDIGVNKATKSLFQKVATPEEMLDLGIDGLIKHIKTIGLFNSKAKNIILLSKELIEKHSSLVPNDFKSLVALPGVGIKTANVVLNCAFNEPTVAVDTHVFRVSNRLGIVKTKTPETTGDKIIKVIPKKWLQHAHHWLILQGRYICKARNPLCIKCPIINYCCYKNKNL
jgi:endonuclease-3